jgi:hypothetical protein
MDLTSNGPGLIFGAYTGHSIEFKVNTYKPTEAMSLKCDGWCQLVCKRVKEDQSIGQEIPFSLISVLDDGNFCDVTLKSSDNVIVSNSSSQNWSYNTNFSSLFHFKVQHSLTDPSIEWLRLQHHGHRFLPLQPSQDGRPGKVAQAAHACPFGAKQSKTQKQGHFQLQFHD